MTPLNEDRVRYWQNEIWSLPADTIIPSDYLALCEAWRLAFQDFPEDTLEEVSVAARVNLEDARALLELPRP